MPNISKKYDPRFWDKWSKSGAIKASRQDPKLAIILSDELVNNVIDEAIGNWTQRHFKTPDPEIKAVLLRYATRIANKILGKSTPFPDFSPKWKSEISDRVHVLLDYKMFKQQQVPVLVSELWKKFGDTRDYFENGLWGYSISKIANTVGMVAYMVNIGLDSKLIMMTPEEANNALLELANNLKNKHPEKVLTVDPSIDSVSDVVSEVLLLTNPPDITQYLPR